MFALTLACLASALPQASGPVEFGRKALERACTAAGLPAKAAEVELRTVAGGASESFVLRTDGARASIEAPDASGAMYGELELAERIERTGAKAFDKSETKSAPFLAVRALNPFLTLPWDSDKNEPVYDAAALNDPARWWFHDEDYWTTLLDLMAEARLNQLDVHGAYDIDTTRFPNLYAYFIDAPSFPAVGVAKEIKAKNLAQLAHVIEMAHARGIKVSLMSYEAQFYTPHNPKPPYESSEANLYKYTREVVEALIRALPGLDTIGFRIGESGHGAEFFKCYTEAVKASGRDIPLYTRSWITTKRVVVPLAQASSDFTVEIKFNGEQWGPPYPIAGGRVPGWHSYSFEDYLSDSNVKSAAKMWPGDLAENNERWPEEPYKIVWQVRANGTHRIFPFYEPDWVRRTIQSMPLGTARGFTVEALNSYFPATPAYYIADPSDQWCKWIHQRDALWLIQWGRLGYDPKTPEDVFEHAIEKHLGKGVKALAQEWKEASRVVPTGFTAWSMGPDHRDHAPELEWGGGLDDFIQTEPFDSHVFMSTKEALALQATGGHDGRSSPADVPMEIRSHAREDENHHDALNEIEDSITMLRGLSQYFDARAHAAYALAQVEAGVMGQDTKLEVRAWYDRGPDEFFGWNVLADFGASRFYKPFTDRLRMGTNHFHWKDELPKIEAEAARLAKLFPGTPPASRVSEDVRRVRPSGPQLVITSRTDDSTTIELDASSTFSHISLIRPSDIKRAWLLSKPLPSSTFFHAQAMERNENGFVMNLPRMVAGQLVAAEYEVDGKTLRIPDWSKERPYLVVPAKPGPTPLYYSSSEALTYLKPASLDPAKHGMLLLATRAWDFHKSFDVSTQRKILDGVRRGLKLVVLQQDYVSGRYPLDWMPKRPKIENAKDSKLFDPAGQLGLEKVECDGVLWQPIRESAGWEVFGNGGLARCALGKGEIWLCQARLMQNMFVPGCARNLKKLLELGGREKPVVVIDAGSEGNRFSTSVFCDFMNAHDIPFLTLGEVIVAEQGMDSFTKVPGIASADRVLEGRGEKMVHDWLASRMRAACSRPVPATREAFETERARRKREFMRSLGLDPLPPRTPLEAKITGTLERDTYTIEKLVYESRPDFPVTAHLYVPKGHKGEKLPVLVNPTGHWEHKKTEPTEQVRLIDEVRNGYLAIEVDSPGHSFEGEAKIERRGAGTHFDPRNIAGSVTADTIYVWDLVRALDYLETRPEADMSRVGITGVSGGGHATMFAFAADERFKCAVPVCYPSSFLDGWDNGCDCNHVPGYVQVGDRADVIGIRAPAPVFVIGAQDDPEFPPLGTQHTGEKLKAQWKVFGAEDKAWWKLYDGGHDYNQPMREAAIGFFDLYLKQKGDGAPVAELPMKTEPPEAAEMFCIGPQELKQTTMRDLARANVARAGDASWKEVVALNGGLPERVPLDAKKRSLGPDESAQAFTFVSEKGLTIPGLLYEPKSLRGAIVLVSEHGKNAARSEFPIDALVADGFACLAIDVRGFGELPGLDPRLMSYLGIADSFAMGWDAARAAEALQSFYQQPPQTAVVGRGPCASLAALYAGCMNLGCASVLGVDAIASWNELFDEAVPSYTLQPRVMYGASLEHLRKLAEIPVEWHVRGEKDIDVLALIRARFPH
jgi:cephalosporin-C deacetylase-like acetyl esterase